MRSVSDVFIGHPRLAWVVSIVLALCGAICLTRMPVAEYPNITPCTVTVSASYSGASALVVNESVGVPIEDLINSVDDVWYYKSVCNNKGSYTLYVVFQPGTDSNINLVNMQNAVKRAEPKLPSEVVQNNIVVKKSPQDRMAMYCFTTDGSEMDIMELSNFVEKQMADALARLPGVAEVSTSGRTYAMRIWLNPIKMTGLNIGIAEVKSAIESQNIQAAAGTIGSEYSNKYLSFTLNVKGRLKTKEEFENIVVRSNPETGAQVLVKDIARVELGCKGYTTRSRFNDNPGVFLSIYKAPEANAVTTVKTVKAEVERWIARMPKGVVGVLADDTTAFTIVFLKETFKTLLLALVLVVFITYLFLQDVRATLVPTLAIPISLLGTFAFLYPMGYTLNVLTMFGLILVIGSLVDDAIVVVENTQAIMQREGLSAREASSKSMRQITGAVLATTLVTLACYLPLAFYKGMVGKMYVQFAVTMCTALCISTLVALTLSPMLCAYILRPPRAKSPRVFLPFNFVLDTSRRTYLGFVKLFVRHGLVTLIFFAAALGLLKFISDRVPTSFLPDEDRGYIMVDAQLPEGQTISQTIDVIDEVHDRVKTIPGVQSISSTCGNNRMDGTGENLGTALVRLDHWDTRKTPEKSVQAIMDEIRRCTADIYAAKFSLFTPPAIRGLGGTGGVRFSICDATRGDPVALKEQADRVQEMLATNPAIARVRHGFSCATPQLDLKLDRRKAEMLGLTPKLIFQTLQNKLASYYVNDFNIKGGVYQVRVQSESDYRAGLKDVMDIHVPGTGGAMVPLSSFATLDYKIGPRELLSFNKMMAAEFNVQPAPGVATSEIMKLIQSLDIPHAYIIEWNGITRQEEQTHGQLVWLMAFALVFAYLFLVAQYESWTIPVPVMLSVAFAILGAFLGLYVTNTALSIYAQLGMVMLIALSAKNAILMVEFSRQERASGKNIEESAYNGANLRFRAVMMTAWSFIFGVLPLVFATGAGAGAMRAIGICTCAGMLAATLVGVIFVPALYSVFQRVCEHFSRKDLEEVHED